MVTIANNDDKYSLKNLSIWTIAQSVSMIPLVKDRVSIHPNDILHNQTIQAFIIFHVMFKLLGVNAFQKLTLAHNLASTARKAMYHHFDLITKVMKNMIRVNIGNLRNLKQGEDLTFVETSTPWLTSAWYLRDCVVHGLSACLSRGANI